jgi:hypothetical protein
VVEIVRTMSIFILLGKRWGIAPQADEHPFLWARRAKAWGIAHSAHPAAIELRQRFFSGAGDPRDFAWLVAWSLNGFPRLLLDRLQARRVHQHQRGR